MQLQKLNRFDDLKEEVAAYDRRKFFFAGATTACPGAENIQYRDC